MGYLDTTDAEMKALTRLRRAERALALLHPAHTPRDELRMRAWKEAEWAAGNRRCAYCNCRLYRQGRQASFDCQLLASVDHRDPLGRGGAESEENYAMACVACNGAKGNMTEAEFRALFAAAWIAIAAE